MTAQIVTRRVRWSQEQKNPLDPGHPKVAHFTATVHLSVDVDTIAYQLALKAAKTKKRRARALKGLIVADLMEVERGR